MEDETLEIKSESPTETEETTQEKIDTTTENENITADTPEQVTEVLQTKGFDYAELQKEFVDTGEISADTRKKLSDVGITDELIDNYIDGQLKEKVFMKLINGKEMKNVNVLNLKDMMHLII